ncbi:MAG: hypothetical protein Ct9H300mP13_1650 [Gammaproteobacteria bacterium]|nr:MAG: hypothetical protein Ct9H300mP13_1650 [Gammaproteobacteria bacterium]
MKLVTKLLVTLTFIGTLLLGSVAAYPGPVTLNCGISRSVCSMGLARVRKISCECRKGNGR